MKHLYYWITGNRKFLDIETIRNLDIEPLIPWWITLFLAALATGSAIYLYLRVKDLTRKQRTTLQVIRSAAYLALLFILLAPQLVVDGNGRPSGPLPVVVDRTESMTIKDVGETSRLKAAYTIDQAVSEKEKAGLGLTQHPYLYGRDVVPWNRLSSPVDNPTNNPPPVGGEENGDAGIEPDGQITSLTRMIDGSLRPHRGSYVPGILLIGDGANNSAELLEPEVDNMVKQNIPVYFIPTGRERPRDIALDHIIGDDIVFVEEAFKFFVSMKQSGYTGMNLPVKASFGSAPLEIDDCRPEKEGETVFPIEHTPEKTGLFELTVEIPPDSKEVTAKNNRITRKVRVIKDRIKALLVFGEPGWEYRFLSGAFNEDRRVKQSVYLQNIDTRIFEKEQDKFIRMLPDKKEDLFRGYDMVIISDIIAGMLPEDFRKSLRDFVAKEGGGLVLISDDRHIPYSLKNTELEDMLPVTIDDIIGPASFRQEMSRPLAKPYRLRIAKEGHGSRFVSFDADKDKNAEIWARFPDMYEPCPKAELKPSAIMLVEAYALNDEDTQPAIVYHNYGHGIVLYMGFDSTWRWRKEYGDRYFRDFWGKVVQFLGLPHMLGGQAQSRIMLNRMECAVQDRIVVTAHVRNKDYTPHEAQTITVTMRLPDNSTINLELASVADRPGVYRAAVYPDREGKFVFSLEKQFMAEEQDLNVVDVSREFKDSGVNMDLISRIANKTGGLVFHPEYMSATNAIAGSAKQFSDKQKERTDELLEKADSLKGQGRDPLEDPEYVGLLASHALKTISERRVPTRIEVDQTLWDTPIMLIIAAMLFCIEYFLRKRWYLD